MNILAIGPHPDDLEYGCGGTLARYAAAGHHVTMLVLTQGGEGGDGATRRTEQEAAAKILGIQNLNHADYPDTRIPLDKDFISFLEEIMKKTKPDIIFVHHGDDTHQDHRTVHTAVLSAARYVPNLLFYEGPTTLNFQPSVFVDIESVLHQKIQALEAHASQMEKTNIPAKNILDMALSTATFRGIQARVRSAEAFHSARLFLYP